MSVTETVISVCSLSTPLTSLPARSLPHVYVYVYVCDM